MFMLQATGNDAIAFQFARVNVTRTCIQLFVVGIFSQAFENVVY